MLVSGRVTSTSDTRFHLSPVNGMEWKIFHPPWHVFLKSRPLSENFIAKFIQICWDPTAPIESKFGGCNHCIDSMKKILTWGGCLPQLKKLQGRWWSCVYWRWVSRILHPCAAVPMEPEMLLNSWKREKKHRFQVLCVKLQGSNWCLWSPIQKKNL